MPRTAAVAGDEAHVLRLIEARYGTALPQTKLRSLLQRNPQLDHLDWSLLLIAIEIDLRVNMEPALLDVGRWTVGKFARAVASLPKVRSVTHTVDLITLLADELLRTPSDPVENQDRSTVRRRSSKSRPTANHAPRYPTSSTRPAARRNEQNRALVGPARAR